MRQALVKGAAAAVTVGQRQQDDGQDAASLSGTTSYSTAAPISLYAGVSSISVYKEPQSHFHRMKTLFYYKRTQSRCIPVCSS